jgi:hypothetical protein
VIKILTALKASEVRAGDELVLMIPGQDEHVTGAAVQTVFYSADRVELVADTIGKLNVSADAVVVVFTVAQ